MRLFQHPAVRWLMTILLLVLLGFQLWSRSNHFANLSLISFDKTFWWFTIVFFMMPINWLLETFKWRTLLSIHIRIPFAHMVRAVVGGVALSIFTPNRIGEYGGRIMFMPSNAKWPVAISTLIGSLAQNLVGFSAGIVACFFLFDGLLVFKIIGIVLILTGVLCFFNVRKVIKRISALNIHSVFKKLVLNLQYIDDYSYNILFRVLAFALVRYLVYITQFVLILHAFEPGISLNILVLGVSAIYLFQTLVPLPPIADVMARANIGLILWSGSGMSELSITLGSLMIWLVNLLIPAMIGSFAIGTTTPLISLDTHEPILPSDFLHVAPEQPDITPTGHTTL
ncbi:MAG: lysylphosphatidylglycerol synthase domain-containing protein [Saprospiraceae bacterium]